MSCQPGTRRAQVARTTCGAPAARAVRVCMHRYGYASEEVYVCIVIVLLPLMVAFQIWTKYGAKPSVFASLVMGACCTFIVVRSVFSPDDDAGWWRVIEATALLDVLVIVEIIRAFRSRRRSAIPVAIVSALCCRVARDGPDKPDHPALCSGRGGRVCQAV
jgi:hypothetical protein